MKYFNFERYKFSRILKNLNLKKLYFSRIYKNISFKYNFTKIYKPFNVKLYRFPKVYKYINLSLFKRITTYLLGIVIFSVLIYLSTPIFFNYNKSNIEDAICKGLKIRCSIEGNINYGFIPSPRLKIENLIIYDLVEKSKHLGEIKNAEIKLSVINLLDKDKLTYQKLILRDAKFNYDLEKINKYKKYFSQDINSIDINLYKGSIEFFDEKKYITTLKDINFKYNFSKKTEELTLNGIFLNDDIYINLKNKKDLSKKLILKLKNYNLLTKIDFFNSKSKKDIINGNILFKKGKTKFTGIFALKDEQIIIEKSNLRNSFLDGKINGSIKFLPFFNFNLVFDLNNLNFNTLLNLITSLDEDNQKNLFRINKKINGKLNISSAKVFSKYTLVRSFESQIQFVNGNIRIGQLLLSLGKLGAADLNGVINNDKKFSNFKFESNIFIDNMKRFYNKFGVFNKQKNPYNLFTSGNFDLTNLKLQLYEISSGENFKNEEINFIENELNNLLLDNGYESLFNFSELKKFIKIMTVDTN